MAVDSQTIHRVAIIGSGFGGLGMAWYLRNAGIEDFVVLEKARHLGGTWRENTYPGAGCDIPSHFYSYSFESRHPWACRYAPQAEILAYQEQVARKYDLERHLRYGVEVVSADFDAARALWVLRSAEGAETLARAVVSAVGQLHRPALPKVPGLERFTGPAFHSATWDHSVPLAGKRVGVIGTGASAVQFVPAIAPQVGQLSLFQRSPGWVIPKFEHRFSRVERWLLETLPVLHDIDRLRIFLVCELLAKAYNGNRLAERLVTWFSGQHMRRQLRHKPELLRKLTPDFPVGCKRILLSNDWLPALARDNVEVVDTAIREVTEAGVVTADGREHPLDVLIYGTGFAATQFLAPMQVRGLDGQELSARWSDGASAYLGMAVPGFPSFFMLYGPNTNLGSGSIIYMLEQQQRYITRLLARSAAAGWDAADLRPQAAADYAREVDGRSAGTTYSGNCQSWYKTADGRNTNNWVGSMREYARRTREPELSHYQAVRAGGAPG